MADQERGLTILTEARAEGSISEESLKALKKANPNRLTLGGPINQLKGDGVLLVASLIDDSGSIGVIVDRDPKTGKSISRSASYNDPKSNAEAVRIGHNAVIQALTESANPSAIWFHTRYLNGRELNQWNPLAKATKMNRDNYQEGGGTPLYDETVVILGSTIAKTEEFRNNLVAVRTATLLVTDGADYGSEVQTADSVKSVITDMYNMGIHIVAAMGIDDGSTDFRDVFIKMGIRENLILTPGSSPEEIRKSFGLFGKMASRATDLKNFKDTLKDGFLALPPGDR